MREPDDCARIRRALSCVPNEAPSWDVRVHGREKLSYVRQRSYASHQARAPFGILGPDLSSVSSVPVRQVPPAFLWPQEYAQEGNPRRIRKRVKSENLKY